MTRDVHITVTGTQLDTDGQKNITELKVQGQYFEKNHSRYLLYEEKDSGTGAVTKSSIKIKDSAVEVSKTGFISSRMVFLPGESHGTSYITPYGTFTLDILTESLKSFWTESSGTLQVDYRLSQGEILLSQNILSVKIRNLSDRS